MDDKADEPLRTKPGAARWAIRVLAPFGGALAIGGVALAGSLLLLNRSDAVEVQAVEAALPVPVIVAEASDGYAVTRSFAGRVVARRETALAFELSGLVTEILADEGDRVAAGDTVALLDTRDLRLSLQRLDAERAELQARLALAVVTRERQQQLTRQGHASAQRYDEARFEEQALTASIERVDSAVAAIELDLDKSALRAPFAGTVGARMMDEGAVASPGAPVLQLLETDHLEAHVGVPAHLAGAFDVASRHRLLINGTPAEGVVRAVRRDLNTDTRTVTVVLEIDGDLSAPDGEIARLLVEEPVPQAGIWLPHTALTEGLRGLWTVFVVVEEADGTGWRVERAEVEVLHSETDRAFVRGTVAAADRVVEAGIHRLVPGQRVRPLAAGMAALPPAAAE